MHKMMAVIELDLVKRSRIAAMMLASVSVSNEFRIMIIPVFVVCSFDFVRKRFLSYRKAPKKE